MVHMGQYVDSRSEKKINWPMVGRENGLISQGDSANKYGMSNILIR